MCGAVLCEFLEKKEDCGKMAVINKKSNADPGDICRLAVQLGVSNATAAVLINRGINSEEIGRQFLDCDDSLLNDPFDMLGMYEAVDLISEAVEEGRRITIYGDYDVDGITSVCILYKYLKSIGARVNCYIPNRFTEGYGMNMEAITKIASKDTEIIIALDCGITSINEVALAKELGLDVMIVDHHNPPEQLPDADIILNPKQEGCEYPFKELCSAGLAMKIVQAHGGIDAAREYIDVAAVGTVADIVPLMNENRYFVKQGIDKINRSPCCGIKALKTVAGYQDKPINARGVAFGLAPRLNAAGRMSSAKDGLNMFLAEDFKTAFDIAVRLNEYNEERRRIEREIYDTGLGGLGDRMCDKRINIVTGEGWNKGVIGIAASRFVEQYHRPAIVISCGDDVCTASARSIPGFDIYDALCTAKDLYTKFGGHSQAAGFSLPRANIPEFTARLEKYAEEHITEEMLIPAIDCEIKLSPADINTKMAKELSSLEPFGKDNESPLFYADGLEFRNSVIIGKDKNVLKTALGAGGLSIDCVGFGKADYIDIVNCSAPKSAVFSVDINQWQGVEKVQLGLKELKIGVETDNDIDGILDAMYMRHYEAFESGFAADKRVPGDRMELDDVFNELSAHKMGTLVVVNDRITAKELLQRIVKADIGGNVDIHIGKIPHAHEFGANTLLLMPYQGCIQKGEYTKVFLPEYIDGAAFGDIGEYGVYRSHSPYMDCKKHDRNAFAGVYKAMHEQVPKLSQWCTLDYARQILVKTSGVELSTFDIKLMLNVFQQLGFILFEEADGMLKMSFNGNIKKRQLTESGLFVKYCDLTIDREDL